MKSLKDLGNLVEISELSNKELREVQGGWITLNDFLTKLYGKYTAILNGKIVFYN